MVAESCFRFRGGGDIGFSSVLALLTLGRVLIIAQASSSCYDICFLVSYTGLLLWNKCVTMRPF